MDAEHVNVISTAVIALVTILVAAAGMYYNLWQVGTSIRNILILELAFIIAILSFIGWMRRRIRK
mgnify:CR=1 FL=1